MACGSAILGVADTRTRRPTHTASVPPAPPAALPTNLAPLARLLAYAQGLGLERHLHRLKRGVPGLASIAWTPRYWG